MHFRGSTRYLIIINLTGCKEIMHKKHKLQKHVMNLIKKTGFKKFHIAEQIGISPEQLSFAIRCRRAIPEHREAIFCFLKHYIPEIKQYKDVWLEDRLGTVHFKNAA